MPANSTRALVLASAVAAMQLGTASAEAQVQLSRDAGGTIREVSGAALTTSGGDTLNVICNGFKCQEVVAAITPGPTILSATGATDMQTNFAVPASLPPTATLELRVCAGADPKACVTKVAPVATLSIKPGATAPTRAQIIDFCANVGNEQSAEMLETRGKNDFTVVIFDETGPCYLSRQFGSEGDAILVGFVTPNANVGSVALDLDPCNTLEAGPKILKSADISTLAIQSRADVTGLMALWFPPVRRCFGTSAGIKVSVTKDAQTKQLAYTLKQFERYRATLQVGVAFSDLHQQEFGLRTDGSVKRIYEKTADENGPEYIASIVLYGVGHYFGRRSSYQPCEILTPNDPPGKGVKVCPKERPRQRETYFGRDPVNDNGVVDRLGLLMGAGLNQPGRRFLVGGSFELMTGVNVFLTREFVRTSELEGVAVGDAFAGEESTIPKRDHWRQAWTGGVSLDARYALALFGRK